MTSDSTTTTTTTTTREVAEAFGISIPSATRLALLPGSPAIKVGGLWRWPAISVVQAWLEARTAAYRGHPVDHP